MSDDCSQKHPHLLIGSRAGKWGKAAAARPQVWAGQHDTIFSEISGKATAPKKFYFFQMRDSQFIPMKPAL